jgi:anti-sigma-K factor RskA
VDGAVERKDQSIPEIIEKSGDLLAKTIPVLDKSENGWWRLIAIVASVAVAVSGVAIVLKLDPQSFKTPNSVCRIVGDSFTCE